MSTHELVEQEMHSICELVLQKRGYSDEPFEDYLTEIIEECHNSGIHRADAEFNLQEKFGDDLKFTELFKSIWDQFEMEKTGQYSLSDPEQSVLRDTPLIPDSVFDKLPLILNSGTRVFIDKRQRDVFLISSLSTLSSILDGITGVYSGNTIHPTQFSFILAPAASGKSAMKYAVQLVEPIHLLKLEQSNVKLINYKKLKREYDLRLRSAKEDPGEPPIEPKMEIHFIPGNSSSASMLNLLDANGGVGLIAETEADSLTSTFGSEWGNFSDIMRKAFHHEPIRMSRKTNNEFKELLKPRFSICISGTPDQVLRLIQSSEDGLFSRICFYAFASPEVWINPSPENHRINYTEYFAELSTSASNVFHFHKDRQCEFLMTEAQWLMFNDHFENQLELATTIYGPSASSVIYRLGIICFRTAMVLSALEHFDNQSRTPELFCSDRSFSVALSICKVLQTHAELMFRYLPRSGNSIFGKPDPQVQFYNELPQNFSRSKAVEIGLICKVGQPRTIDGLLHKWCTTSQLTKVKSGQYSKQVA